MLRPLVPKRFAMRTSVSPGLTVYVANVGPGVGVGRTNDGVDVGPAGVGTGVGSPAAADPSGDGLCRLAGVGTHAATTTRSIAARSHRTRIVE
jgi:hypothetical protein